MNCDICGSSNKVSILNEIDQTDLIKNICKECKNELESFQKKLWKAERAILEEENRRINGFSLKRIIRTRSLQIGRMKDNYAKIIKKYFKIRK